MERLVIDWKKVISVIIEFDSITVTELAGQLCIDFDWLRALYIRRALTAEPRYFDGTVLLKRYFSATDNSSIPMFERPEKLKCAACFQEKPIGEIIRRLDGGLRCLNCAETARIGRNKIYRENKKRAANG